MAYAKPGPKSLANLKPVKKGEVRNPKGINRKRPWTDRMLEMTETILKKSAMGEEIRRKLRLPETATWSDGAVLMLMRRAVQGEVAAIKELADRTEGKVAERLEVFHSGQIEHVLTEREKLEAEASIKTLLLCEKSDAADALEGEFEFDNGKESK
jgi:hypothetical protein